jgi:predicted RNA binding protein YcfA (HicA-like mRNA interferase family)
VSPWAPCKRREFIKRLRKLGFDGPFTGTRHHFMVYKENRLAIPSNKEYSIAQLKMMLREVGSILGRKIRLGDWNRL